MVKFDDLLAGKEYICVVGLGYVGLPLAVAFSKYFKVIGYDKNERRIKELLQGLDRNNQVEKEELLESKIKFTTEDKSIAEAKFIIIAVPTPVDKLKNPDLSFLKDASKLVGRNLKRGTVVVYESTVYPGATEEVCIPILEKESNLTWKKDFFVGYSPERVNPGDKKHTLEKVVKVVAGDTPETLELLASVYGTVIKAGVFKAKDIKTAEAAKVIENIQRDINIALMNELALIFNKLGLDTKSVLEAASTKWNFLPFEPGLVGGHCIPVDPYYLAYKAQTAGYIPKLILAGRSINEEIPNFVAKQMIKLLTKAGKMKKGAKVIIFGITFKENVPDIRNSKVIDIFHELKDYGIETYIYDPIADPEEVFDTYKIELLKYPEEKQPYDGAIIAVKHNEFLKYPLEYYMKIMNKPYILLDIKGIYSLKEEEDIIYFRL